MLNAFVVVWRESFEAVLIIGILAAALRQRPGAWERGRAWLALGVAGGVALAGLLAAGIMFAQSELEGAALEWFQTGMLLVAAGLIVQMCLWMRAHGRTLKRDLEASVEGSVAAGGAAGLAGVAGIAAIAVGREGMETVLFLYGTGLEAIEQGAVGTLAAYAAAGLLAAIATGWAFSRGLRVLSQKAFFRVSTALLLVVAGGLVVQAASRLVQAEVLPPLVPQVWDTSWLLDEGSAVGGVVSMFTGYQNSPALSVVIAYAAFWACYVVFSRLQGRQAAGAPARASERRSA